MTSTNVIVSRLWNHCHGLRDAGVGYLEFVTELTYLLFLKMSEETGQEQQIPKGYRWKDLASLKGVDLLDFYKLLLVRLGTKTTGRLLAIYKDSNTRIKKPKNLEKIVTAIDELDWFSAREEGLGDLYEGLLEKGLGEKKSGAGQYFTPRPLVEVMVSLMRPQPGETIQDPAMGTGGFLVVADRFVKEQTDDLFDLSEEEQRVQRLEVFSGVEYIDDTFRLALMNTLLHGMGGEFICDDTLSPVGAALPKVDLILTNPPFGTQRGGTKPTRSDFTYETSNKQLAFLQHIYRGLKKGGRAAVVLPDNVLFEDGKGVEIREDLMNKCDLHTILRLPTGIFYAGGVKTNVLFFTRGQTEKGNTKKVWIYDMRTNMPSFGKRNPLTVEHFAEFERAFGNDPLGKSKRKDEGEEGRWRCFDRAFLKKRNWNLDISWLRDESVEHADDLPEPDEIAADIMGHLRTALEEMEALTAVLEGEAPE